MKNLIYFIVCIFATLACVSCMRDVDEAKSYDTRSVRVALQYPASGSYTSKEGVKVRFTNTLNNTIYETETDADGVAECKVTPGIYSIMAQDIRPEVGSTTILNGSVSGQSVSTESVEGSSEAIKISLVESKVGQIVIKEFYIGGCQNNAGKNFAYDKYMILYNNSDYDATLTNLCFAMMFPYNGNSTNPYAPGGVFSYDTWLPAAAAYWYFKYDTPTLKPGKQIVVAFNNALDNTTTASNSVDLSKPEYYVTYDPECGYTNAAYHPAPSENIPSTHYLRVAYKYGMGNAWALSLSSPAVFIFATEGVDPVTFATTADNQVQANGSATTSSFKVPTDWILDGVEVFQVGQESKNNKRMLASVDAGSVYHITYKGYTLYRNVDVDATKAIEGNADKIVYNYKYGTTDVAGGSDDPSGIDAEASIKNGARIVYQDTNNSTADFHLRKQSSLKD